MNETLQVGKLAPEEEAAASLLVYEFIRLKERNATDSELTEWRDRVEQLFPRRREAILGRVAGNLSQFQATVDQ